MHMNIEGFRTVGLALVTLLGAAHLSTAEATPLATDPCEDNATGFAAGFCSAMGHDDWGSVTYECVDGRARVVEVECVDTEDEPESVNPA
jgi:hypothetical protein